MTDTTQFAELIITGRVNNQDFTITMRSDGTSLIQASEANTMAIISRAMSTAETKVRSVVVATDVNMSDPQAKAFVDLFKLCLRGTMVMLQMNGGSAQSADGIALSAQQILAAISKTNYVLTNTSPISAGYTARDAYGNNITTIGVGQMGPYISQFGVEVTANYLFMHELAHGTDLGFTYASNQYQAWLTANPGGSWDAPGNATRIGLEDWTNKLGASISAAVHRPYPASPPLPQ